MSACGAGGRGVLVVQVVGECLWCRWEGVLRLSQ